MSYEIAEIVSSLKLARTEKGISQRELSDLSGIPQAQISKLENGQADVRMSTLVAVSRALGLEIELVPRKYVPAVQAIVRRNQAAEGAQRYALVSNSFSGLTASSNGLKDAHEDMSDYRSVAGKSAYSLTDNDDE